ncbi:MAG TPA: thiamine pyrophosphate-binding protein [Candidatus Acidoferrales bacterium]|nr:thiamine pyrophosphate-binding protein [Candidatus Acidoferrales bacterium]
MKERFGSDLIVDLFKLYEMEYAAVNPGSTFRALHDSIVNYGANRNPELITCSHEEIAVGIAHGYAKATGRPMLAIVHDVVGLLHATFSIYYAYLDRAPVIVIGGCGAMALPERRAIDWVHNATLQGNAVRDFVKWDDQPFSIESIPESFARAYRVATTEPQGPVYVCFEMGLQEAKLEHQVRLPNRERLQTPPPLQGDPASIRRAAEMLARAENPVIVADYAARDRSTFHALVALAERLGAAVIDLNGRLNFPNTHPLCLTGSDILRSADVVLALDVRDLYDALVEIDRETGAHHPVVSPAARIIDIGFGDLGISKWSHEYGRIQEVDLQILGDARAVLPALLDDLEPLVSAKQSLIGERSARHRSAHEGLRAEWARQARENWDARPISTARLAHEIWQAIKDEDWVLTANTLSQWTRRLWSFTRPEQHPGDSLGTGTNLGISLGVALANRGSKKLVVDIQPDGDLMFDPGGLWTAAHQNIPLLVVMYNNRGYYNDWAHQIRLARQRGNPVERAAIGMEIDRPPPDFAKLAQAFGWYAEGPIENPDEVGPALTRAIRALREEGKPALVDTVTQFR